jgi:hypothetical protein
VGFFGMPTGFESVLETSMAGKITLANIPRIAALKTCNDAIS